METVRLDKFLADALQSTRSEVKKQIRKGQVFVNGACIRNPEARINPDTDQVTAGGQALEKPKDFVYYLLHKPAGYVSATEDPREKTVLDLVPKGRRNLFPVGRLDKDTEGLLLITDDGPLAHDLLSPAKHVDKTYFAVVSGQVTEEDIGKVKEGLEIGEKRPTLPADLSVLRVYRNPEGETLSDIHLTIHEGKFHQVKRMMAALGKPVQYLRRISMGSLTLPDDLPPGQYMEIEREKIG